MRVLLDACVPERFARFISGYDVITVRAYFGTTDLDDGPVLDRLTDHFDAFVTVDKHLRFQQNLCGRPFRVVLLRAHSNAIENLVSAHRAHSIPCPVRGAETVQLSNAGYIARNFPICSFRNLRSTGFPPAPAGCPQRLGMGTSCTLGMNCASYVASPSGK